MTKHTKELLKNAAIVLLAISALILGSATGVFSQLFVTLNRTETPTVSEVSLREATRPVSLATTGASGLHCGFKYSQTLDTAYNNVKNLLGEALGSSGAPEKSDEYVWRSLLGSPGIYFDFGIDVPLAALAGWLGTELLNSDWARYFCIAVDNGGVILMYMSADGKNMRCCDTASREGSIRAAVDAYMPNGAVFAFEKELFPGSDNSCQLILAELPQQTAVTASSASMDNDGLLEVFGMNPRLTSRYTEKDGTLVFLESWGTLKISPDGEISYLMSEHYSAAPHAEQYDLPGSIEAARSLAFSTMGSVCGDAGITLSGITVTDDGYTLYFDYYIAGVGVRQSRSAAVITMRDGYVSEAVIQLRRYMQSTEELALMPELQAVVAAAAKSGEARLYYCDDGRDKLEPTWILDTGGAS